MLKSGELAARGEHEVATIRKLRGRWQAQVRRRALKPKAKSFDTKVDAEAWARNLEVEPEFDCSGTMPGVGATRPAPVQRRPVSPSLFSMSSP